MRTPSRGLFGDLKFSLDATSLRSPCLILQLMWVDSQGEKSKSDVWDITVDVQMRTGSSFSQDTCFLRCSPALLQSIELSIIGLSGNKSSKCHNQGSIGSDRAPWPITLHIQALRGATFSPRVLTGYTTGNVMINLERNSHVLGRQHPPGNLSLNMSACKFQEFINY